MQTPLLILVCVTSLCCPRRLEAAGLPEDVLRRLSLEGEEYVDEEIKRALLGMKHMKEVMESNQEKHQHLLTSLRHSIDKKEGVEQLAKEAGQKLMEAEQHCQRSLKSSWEKCRPCLEDACKTFYTSTCRRGFSSFSFKVEEFFRKMSFQFQPPDSQDKGGDQSIESLDVDLERAEDSFSGLQTRVRALYDKAVVLVSSMHKEFDSAFQAAFTSNSTSRPLSLEQAVLEPGFFQGIRLDDVLESFFDFGRSVMEEFSSVITGVFDEVQDASEWDSGQLTGREVLQSWVPSRRKQLCRNLKRQTSECWRLQGQCESCQGALFLECPSVRKLYMEMLEISQLLNVSRQQYEEVLQVVQRHADDTIGWLTDMAARFGWVAELADLAKGTNDNEGIFTITAVVPHEEEEEEEGNNGPGVDTSVELNILNSSRFTLQVPAELQVEDPAFIQYVANEALGRFKQTMSNALA